MEQARYDGKEIAESAKDTGEDGVGQIEGQEEQLQDKGGWLGQLAFGRGHDARSLLQAIGSGSGCRESGSIESCGQVF